jgi:hypothetical protein
MALWQLGLADGIYLADGRECKLLSGIDDHSRFVVCAAVLAVPSGRAVADAFVAAMRTYGVPSEVLTDIQAVHRPVHQAAPGGGAVRAGLPRARHHRQAHRPVLTDHDREGREAAPHAAPRAPTSPARPPTCRRPRRRSPRGCMPTTTCGRTRRWTWPRQAACSAPASRWTGSRPRLRGGRQNPPRRPGRCRSWSCRRRAARSSSRRRSRPPGCSRCCPGSSGSRWARPSPARPPGSGR